MSHINNYIKEQKNIPCIYFIYNKITNKYYIGSTKKFKSRVKNHVSELRRNIHANNILQSSWNKYKEDAFDFFIAQKFDIHINKSQLEQYEQIYLDHFLPKYNILKKAYVMEHDEKFKERLAERRSKTYIVQYLNENPIKISNLRKFCRLKNINRNNLINVLYKKSLNNNYLGWKIKYDDGKDFDKSYYRKRKHIYYIKYNSNNKIITFYTRKDLLKYLKISSHKLDSILKQKNGIVNEEINISRTLKVK